VVEYLPSTNNTLSLTPGTTKKQNKNNSKQAKIYKPQGSIKKKATRGY
jgi:hypothetical protein